MSLAHSGISRTFANWAWAGNEGEWTWDKAIMTAKRMYDHLTVMLDRLLPGRMVIEIEKAVSQWDGFCEHIKAEGDMVAAKRILTKRYNAINPKSSKFTPGPHRRKWRGKAIT